VPSYAEMTINDMVSQYEKHETATDLGLSCCEPTETGSLFMWQTCDIYAVTYPWY